MLPTATVTFGAGDVTCLVESATIRHGRADPDSHPDADTMTVEILGAIPAGVDIGTAVTLVAELAGTDYPRFAGRVTDLAIGWDSVDQPIGTVIAAGALADMGRRVIGDAPYPAESDGARANRAIAAAAVPTDAARTDPGTLQVLARDVDAQPALNVAQDAAQDGGGMVWQTKDGAVVYADADHRRGSLTALALDACAMPLEVAWTRNLEGLANDVRVRYGNPEAEVHATDPTSIAARGTFAASISTRLAAAGDATDRANGILARQGTPSWALTGIGVNLELLTKVADSPADDLAQTQAVLALEMHQLLSVTGMPAGSPYTSTTLWVEGWTEEIAWGSWRIAFAVSDYCRTAPEPRWDDVPDGYTWDTFPDLTWDQSTCVGPIPPAGTWNDVAATLRWDQIDTATTWDNWS